MGEVPEVPPHFVLNFERGAELEPELRKEIAEHHWEVAASNAYPWLVAVDEDLVARPATTREVTMAEAIALALTKVLAEKKSLRAAWDGGEPVSRTLSIPTHQGEIEVTLRAPFVRAPDEFDASSDILADLAALADSSDFGLAKSLLMAGRDAGFDTGSREGIEAWMQSIQGKPLPRSIPIPPLSVPQTGDNKKAKKGKRKAARKSRKRNK